MTGLGAKIARGDPICTIHAASDDAAQEAAAAVLAAVTIGEQPDVQSLVRARIS